MGLKERREREKEERRNQILDAARSILITKGLTGTSVNEIAKMAELSVGAIYVYFKSKEEIFAALQEEGLQILNTMVKEAIEKESDPRKKIAAIVLTYKKFNEEYRNYFDIINYFLTAPEVMFPDHLKSRIDHEGGKTLLIVVQVISEGVQQNIFKTENPRESAILLWGQMHGILQFRKLRETILRDEDFKSLWEQAIEGFIRSIT